MKRVQLIHRHPSEAVARAQTLGELGYCVDSRLFSREILNEMRDDPPDAAVIDLSRAPSFGRDVAISLRTYKDTRHVPLVFVGGDPAKVAGVRSLLPDAVYTAWEEIGPAIAQALADPPAEPVVPSSAMAAYSGTPLVKKLGIKPGATVVLLGAPLGFEHLLAGLPPDAVVSRESSRERDLTIWFVRSKRELEGRIAEMAACAEGAGLWISWPKNASGVKSDVSQNVVRAAGLAAGLVDFKISSLDKTWSALRFTVRT